MPCIKLCMDPRDTDSLTFEAKVKFQLNLDETVSMHNLRNCFQILKNPQNTENCMKFLHKWYVLASPLPSRCERSGLYARVCVSVCEMETFLASLLNLSTSYRELWRNALFFSPVKWVWTRTQILPGLIFYVEWRVNDRIEMDPGFLD